MLQSILVVAAGVIFLIAFHIAMVKWTVWRTRKWADRKDMERDYWVWKWKEIKEKNKNRRF